MITSQFQNIHLKPKCWQPSVTGKQFQCFDFNVYKHENVNMVNVSWKHYSDIFLSWARYEARTNNSPQTIYSSLSSHITYSMLFV